MHVRIGMGCMRYAYACGSDVYMHVKFMCMDACIHLHPHTCVFWFIYFACLLVRLVISSLFF